MNVLVAGGTGFVGTALCETLAARGHDVTALARDPTDAALLDDVAPVPGEAPTVGHTPGSVSTVAGDVTDCDTIEDAFTGQDAVVNLVALSPLFQPEGGGDAHDRVHRGGTENCVRAARRHDVDRFVQLSALGADPDGPTAYIRAKGRAEEIVRTSTLDWTIVRPSVVFGDGGEFVGFTRLLTTPYVTGLPGGGKTRFQPIWVGDLAPMLAATVEDDAHVRETYEIGGPAVLTLADVAREIYRSDGRWVRVLPVPMLLAGLGLAVAEYLPVIPMGRDQYRSLQFDNTTEDNDVDAFGVEPDELRTFEAYLTGKITNHDAESSAGVPEGAVEG